MQLITIVIGIYIIAKNGAIRKSKLLPALLSCKDTRSDFDGTVTLRKFIRRSISLNRSAEILCGHQVQILDVIRIDRGRLCPGRTLCHRAQTVPSNAFVILSTRLNRVENTMINTSFVEAFPNFIPNKLTH